jgi:hypothetical protein
MQNRNNYYETCEVAKEAILKKGDIQEAMEFPGYYSGLRCF